MSTEQAVRSIQRRLGAIRNRIVAIEGTVLALRLGAAALGFLLVGVLVGRITPSLGILRASSIVTLLAFAGFAVRSAWSFARRWPRIEWIAAEIERSSSELDGDLLRGALDLGRRRDDGRFGYSPALIEALVREALRKSEAIRDRTVIGLQRLRRSIPLAVLSAVVAVLLFQVVPDRAADAMRALGPRAESRLLTELGLEVSPGDTRVEAGDRVPVEARFAGYRGSSPFLLVRDAGGETKTLPMAEKGRTEGRAFEAEIPPLAESADYLVRFDGGESRWFSALVHRAPVITGIGYTLRFPAYTGLAEQEVNENHGNVTALAGTEVRLRVESSKEARAGRIERDGLPPIPLEAHGASLSGSFTVGERFSYRILVEDGEGGVNTDPVAYRVTPIEDAGPFVRIERPEGDSELGSDMKLLVAFAALDDYGVTSVNLVFRKGEEEEEAKVPLFDTRQKVTEVEREREWDLSGLNLFPQDVVTYYLEAWDNDAVRGPKRGVSETRRIRMPSVADVFASVSEDRDTEIADLEEIYEEGKDVQEKIDELAREISKSEDVSWEDKKKIEGIVDKQKEIEQSLREVSAEVEKTASKVEENNLVTPETFERMMELTRLLNEVATDQMLEAMQQLQAAMRDLKPDEIQAAAANMELTQKDFLERLDRAIEMLKRLKDLQDADALAAAFQRMAEQQRELRERTANADSKSLSDLAKEEEALRDELERLEGAMEEAAKRAGERSPDLSKALQEALAGLKEKETRSTMSRSAEQMLSGKKSEATEGQQKAANDLFDLAFRLSEEIASMCTSSQKKASAAFGESILDLLYLSHAQEEVSASADRVKRSAPIEARRSLAEREQDLSAGLGRVMEKIREVGREVPELSSFVIDMLGRGREKVDDAAARFESGDVEVARTRSDEAMREINRSVVELLRSQENHSSSCNNPNSEGQGLQQMQQMTEQQRGLNMESSQIPFPSANPSALPMETRAEMARLAAEQQQIRKGVEQLQQEVEGGGGGTLGDLDRIAEEMHDVEHDLEKADLKPETREKQERVLSRMLDAQRSIRERGYRKERLSRPGRDVERASPDAVPSSLTEVRKSTRDDPTRGPIFAIPPEYEELIRSYFRSLAEEK